MKRRPWFLWAKLARAWLRRNHVHYRLFVIDNLEIKLFKPSGGRRQRLWCLFRTASWRPRAPFPRRACRLAERGLTCSQSELTTRPARCQPEPNLLQRPERAWSSVHVRRQGTRLEGVRAEFGQTGGWKFIHHRSGLPQLQVASRTMMNRPGEISKPAGLLTMVALADPRARPLCRSRPARIASCRAARLRAATDGH